MSSPNALALRATHSRCGGRGGRPEAVYGQKMDHDFSCSKEEACRCLMVPEWLKITNDPKFIEYARENYIIDDDKICDDDAKGYFSDGSLLLTKRKRCRMSIFLIICRITSLTTIM